MFTAFIDFSRGNRRGITIEIPFTPMVGMAILHGDMKMEITKVIWNVDEDAFHLTCRSI